MELPGVSVSGIAKVTGSAVVVLLAVRGLRLYLRNDITISITELVRLPPASVTSRGNRAHAVDPSAVAIKGKIEVETCVVRSYRFMLKLSGIVKNETPTAVAIAAYSMPSSPRPAGASGAGNASGASFGPSSTAVSRRRVMSSFSPRAIEGSSPSVGDYNASSAGTYDTGSLSSRTTGRRHGSGSGASSQPTLLVDNTNEMVDVCEIDVSGHVCFTPACVMDDTLLTYVASPAPAFFASLSTQTSQALLAQPLADGSEGASPTGSKANNSTGVSAILSAALTGGADGGGNVTVRSCHLQADESARNGMKLMIEVEVANPVHGLQLLIRLPHRRCRLLHAHTGGVGRVHQPLKAKRPHRLIWDIGTVDQARSADANEARRKKGKKSKRKHQKRSKNGGAGYDVEASEAATFDQDSGAAVTNRVEVLEEEEDEEMAKDTETTAVAVDDNVPASVSEMREDILCDPALGLRLLIARCTIVFEQPPDLFLESDDDSSEDDRSSCSGDSSQDSGHDNDQDAVDEENMFASPPNRPSGRVGLTELPPSVRRKSPSNRAGHTGKSARAGGARGAASAPNQSRKAARRSAKRKKKEEERQKRREAAVLAGRGASMRLPSVEITYSTSGLASGTSVKKLQVLSDKPNWVPRSLLDRWVFRRLLYGLENMKLQRFAHYTTWFVQPVPVTTLAV